MPSNGIVLHIIKPNYCPQNMVTYHVASKVVGVVTIPYAAEYNLMMIYHIYT